MDRVGFCFDNAVKACFSPEWQVLFRHRFVDAEHGRDRPGSSSLREQSRSTMKGQLDMVDEIPQRRASLLDVANRAGVAKSVASRVLNGRTSISVRPETRTRIFEAAEALRYIPHAAAQALASARTEVLALLIPDVTNPVYARILRGAVARAEERGYVVLLAEDTGDAALLNRYPDLVTSGRATGLIIGSTGRSRDISPTSALASVPHVFVNRRVRGSNCNVTIDMRAVAAQAVQHLHELGHRRLAHLAGPPLVPTSIERHTGFIEAVDELGLPLPTVVHGEFTEAGGEDAARQLVSLGLPATGVFVGTYRQAVGALYAFREAGIRVPGDISLICSDETPSAAFLHPSLTTLDLPFDELGATAVDAVVAQIRGEETHDIVLEPPGAVIHRGSTAPL
jgi:LacI family transcriptional regulator